MAFVDSAAVRYTREQRAVFLEARARWGADSAAIRAAVAQWSGAHPAPPPPTVAGVADHIEHIRRVAGVDHVGLGSDFDGIPDGPAGLDSADKYPALLAELARRGWSDADLARLAGGNLLRALAKAEEVSARLRATRGPSTATITQLDGPPAAAAH